MRSMRLALLLVLACMATIGGRGIAGANNSGGVCPFCSAAVCDEAPLNFTCSYFRPGGAIDGEFCTFDSAKTCIPSL